MYTRSTIFFFFFFNDTATTEIYTLSLHDALPICIPVHDREHGLVGLGTAQHQAAGGFDWRGVRRPLGLRLVGCDRASLREAGRAAADSVGAPAVVPRYLPHGGRAGGGVRPLPGQEGLDLQPVPERTGAEAHGQ